MWTALGRNRRTTAGRAEPPFRPAFLPRGRQALCTAQPPMAGPILAEAVRTTAAQSGNFRTSPVGGLHRPRFTIFRRARRAVCLSAEWYVTRRVTFTVQHRMAGGHRSRAGLTVAVWFTN